MGEADQGGCTADAQRTGQRSSLRVWLRGAADWAKHSLQHRDSSPSGSGAPWANGSLGAQLAVSMRMIKNDYYSVKGEGGGWQC